MLSKVVVIRKLQQCMHKFGKICVLSDNAPKEARSKLWGSGGGVNTFVKIKCLRRRTALIQSALCSPDLGECFTYPEHVFNLSRKFFRGSQSQKPPKNT